MIHEAHPPALIVGRELPAGADHACPFQRLRSHGHERNQLGSIDFVAKSEAPLLIYSPFHDPRRVAWVETAVDVAEKGSLCPRVAQALSCARTYGGILKYNTMYTQRIS